MQKYAKFALFGLQVAMETVSEQKKIVKTISVTKAPTCQTCMIPGPKGFLQPHIQRHNEH